MYYKWIANHATYDFENGGDLSFGASIENANLEMVAYGDSEGKPRNQTGKYYIWLLQSHSKILLIICQTLNTLNA